MKFVDEWSDRVLPQLDKVEYKDLTEIFSKTKRSKMILDSIRKGKKIYILGFKNCKGMIKKWLYDSRGRMIREQGRGIVEINPSTITMSVVDIDVPFISSDEVLLVKHHRDKPYNLEKGIVKEAMIKAGFNPAKDIIFIFFVHPKEIDFTINRFFDDFKHIITKGYYRARGVLDVQDPKWIKYHGSEKVSEYTDTFFFNGVQLTYTNREAVKREKEKLPSKIK
ncbi:MAG: hypothetical protein NT130_05485 [Candidatus Micrarchaeota archaeon]|nr:hypothetical protein [Candidatus Micrarchaeota archaeon]